MIAAAPAATYVPGYVGAGMPTMPGMPPGMQPQMGVPPQMQVPPQMMGGANPGYGFGM